MKKAILIFILMGMLCPFANGQQSEVLPKPATGIHQYPDSIRLEYADENAIVLFQVRDIREDMSVINDFPRLIERLDGFVQKALNDLSKPRDVHVTTQANGELKIEIKQNESVTQIRTKDDAIQELLPPGWKIHIINAGASISIYVQNWDDLMGISEGSIREVVQYLRNKMNNTHVGRKRILSRIIWSGEKIAYEQTNLQMPIDMLAINLHGAFGNYRSSFFPELSLSAMVNRYDRFNRPNVQWGLVYENKFFSTSDENGWRAQTKSFLSLAFNSNLYKLEDPFWIGAGAGLLLNKPGPYFQGKTMKFFLTTGSKKFTLIPELYLTNDFKTATLGAKLSYTF